MKLTTDKEREIMAIMTENSCAKSFKCYQSKFEDICPGRPYYGANVVQCLCEKGRNCPMSYVFCGDIRFCQCPLRKYVAFQLGR
jgi:hypothetical protein